MPVPQLSPLVGYMAVACLLGFCLKYASRRRRQQLPYPPTPKGIPILGNALQIPFHESWLAFQHMSEALDSDIIHLNAAGESIIVLSNIEDARELLVRRAAKYSSRRQAIMANELMGWGWLMSGLPYGEPWKERRKLFQKYFSRRTNMDLVEERTTKFVHRILHQLLETPEDFQDHIKHLVGGLALSLAYGAPNNPIDIQLAESAIAPAGRAVVPGAYLVDVFPLLRYVPEWMPGAQFKRDARVWKEMMRRYRDDPFETAQNMVAKGTALPSLTTLALAEEMCSDKEERRKEVIKETAGMFFTAGFDTTRSPLTYFVLAMIHFPEVQAKAQAELDRVLGKHRLPEFSDKEELPYISALVEEVLRWWPVTALAVPHYTTSADIYRGYLIPNKAVVIANVWSMLHNENDYPDPHRFIPERYLDTDGKFNADGKVPLPSTIAFGFGRRMCPGLHIATAIVWHTVASVLATFTISPAAGADDTLPDVACQPGLVAFPKPFKCRFQPRPGAHERITGSTGSSD